MKLITGFFFLLLVTCCYADKKYPVPIITPNVESIEKELNKYYKEGKAGIPKILIKLKEGLKNNTATISIEKVNKSVYYLHKLAEKGIYIDEELPLLVEALNKQLFMEDTYLTAETLRLITKIDVGYDKTFVMSYKVEDEEKRKAMVKKWEDFINQKKTKR